MQQQLLRIVASGQPISQMGSSFFTQLSRVSFLSARTRDEQVVKWNATREFGLNLVRTDLTSHNLWTLMIRVNDLLLDLIADITTPPPTSSATVSPELSNLSRIIPIFILHLLSAPHRDLPRYFPDKDLITSLLQSICHVLAHFTITHETVQFHEDLCELLIGLLSEQITSTNVSLYLCTLFSNVGSHDLITAFFTRLLCTMEKGNPSAIPTAATPSSAVSTSTPSSPASPTRKPSFLGAISGWFGGGRAPVDMSRLAELSSYILAILAVQRDLMGQWTSTLFGVRDMSRNPRPSLDSTREQSLDQAVFEFSYKRLLGMLQDYINVPHYVVVLYAMLYHNRMFLEFVLVQMDPDRVILPILRFISTVCLSPHDHPLPNLTPLQGIRELGSPSSTTSLQSLNPRPHRLPFSHLYISMVILIMLTADNTYVDALMTVSIPAPPDWFFDRRAVGGGGMSLASLVTLSIMRVIQTNMTGDRDQYLHHVGMAVINNVSCGWRNMHPLVALRLVTWIEKVVQRWARIQSSFNAELRSCRSPSLNSPVSASSSGLEGIGEISQRRGSGSVELNPADLTFYYVYPFEYSRNFAEIQSTDLAIYTELVSQLLDIVVTVLHPNLLRFNPHLVHALLHKQSLLIPLNGEQAFACAVTEINSTLEYFRARILLDTFEDVLSQINDLAKTYQPGGKQIHNPHFEYSEDVDSPAFFIPFVWHAVYRIRPYLAWDPTVPLAFLDQVDQANYNGGGETSLDFSFATSTAGSMSFDMLTALSTSPIPTLSPPPDPSSRTKGG